jgi:hypothetical protein
MLRQFVINIPKSQWADIKRFLDASNEDIRAIADCIAFSAPLPDLEDLAENCAEKSGVEATLAEAVLSIGVNISSLQRSTGKPLSEILDRAAESFSRSGFPEWEEKYFRLWQERRPFLEELLVTDGTLEVMAKVRELLYECQSILLDSIVMTDVRHVYNSEASDIKGALVLHTLGIEYWEGMEPRQIHITLSDTDLEKVILQLQRAQRKTKVSIALLDKLNIPELTPKRNI